MRKHIPQLPHNAIRSHHRLVRLQPIRRPLIQIQHPRRIRPTRPNHLRSHGTRNVLLLERQQGLQPAPLRRIFSKRRLLLPQPRNLQLQRFVLLMCMPQPNIVRPNRPHIERGSMPHPLKRRHHRNRPIPQQRRMLPFRRTGNHPILRPLHLHRQHDRLCQHDHDQHQRILEPNEKGIHKKLARKRAIKPRAPHYFIDIRFAFPATLFCFSNTPLPLQIAILSVAKDLLLAFALSRSSPTSPQPPGCPIHDSTWSWVGK